MEPWASERAEGEPEDAGSKRRISTQQLGVVGGVIIAGLFLFAVVAGMAIGWRGFGGDNISTLPSQTEELVSLESSTSSTWHESGLSSPSHHPFDSFRPPTATGEEEQETEEESTDESQRAIDEAEYADDESHQDVGDEWAAIDLAWDGWQLSDDSPMLAVVIDDWGYAWEAADAFLSLPFPLNIAVIPYLPYSVSHARRAAENGHQVLLHLPMEPTTPGWTLGEGGITTTMEDEEIRETVAAALQAVPFVTAVNNHMGSKATADRRVMSAVLESVGSSGVLFLDSRTTVHSVVLEEADRAGVTAVANDHFIDPDRDVDLISQRILRGGDVAKDRGWAVVIGHVRTETYRGLVNALPKLYEKGVRLARIDEIVERFGIAPVVPPAPRLEDHETDELMPLEDDLDSFENELAPVEGQFSPFEGELKPLEGDLEIGDLDVIEEDIVEESPPTVTIEIVLPDDSKDRAETDEIGEDEGWNEQSPSTPSYEGDTGVGAETE